MFEREELLRVGKFMTKIFKCYCDLDITRTIRPSSELFLFQQFDLTTEMPTSFKEIPNTIPTNRLSIFESTT